ncbi:transcriptional regulator/sugar kinase [Sphaerochaeta pleomorpha str. Grapes]|uniref:Transcriptional regulator/sugar kinase n=1 Tax=Sphaerochaeta pleomorpha (strain ATCC BAA-1885 / DSM 22778 / Grapes) TaxID=158190 RepID=G8QQE4_SPHPG|nr:ROK family protein [Sphaerochaeta pleomorpha]AEV29789.1 transcriptional regulator/sugar kinase [Sphaerochaeta pleomorpha str. Grapes]
MKFSQPSTARTYNRLRVLNVLSLQKTCSRADIARILNLNKPSTSEIVDNLLLEGLLEERGKKETSNGRRPTTLVLKKDALLVLAVDMGSKNTSVALADLDGNLLRFERFPTGQRPKAQELCYSVIKSCLRMTRLATSPIVGLTVAVNGIIGEDRKTLVSNDLWEWKDVPLAQAIEANTHIPTILVHNVEAMVNAERWFAKEEGQNFLYINWAEHIGSAWVTDNNISAQHARFGHLSVASTGLCRCGNIGCLETVAAGWALSEKNENKTVKQLCSEPSDHGSNDLLAACTAMAKALVQACTITGCQKIILGGGISNIGDNYLQFLSQEYARQAHSRQTEVQINRSQLGDKAGLLGSVATALDTWVFQRALIRTLDQNEIH